MRQSFILYFNLLFFLLLSSVSYSQNIQGRVLDSKTLEALPFANVFLNNTTIGTITDTNGKFNLTSIKEPGTYELVFSFVGYETYKRKVNVDAETLDMGIIKLIPSELELDAVEVGGTRDKDWEKKLKKFKKVFLGDDKQAAACILTHPWVIDFPKDNNGNRFLAKASAPIEIENKALGYKVVFYLSSFWHDRTGYSIIGNARFSELKSVDAEEIVKWKKNRKESYQHSIHHLFKSIIEHKINGEGFNLYTETEGNKNATSRSNLFYSELGQTILPYDTTTLVTPEKQKGFYRITLNGRVEVHYRKEKASVRTYRDVFGPVSWIRLNNNFVIVNKDGFAKNPSDVVVSGDMSASRVANMLPLDYKPEQIAGGVDKINFSMYQEQIYVHTDKPYYYPGETIWYKGYVNYATPAWRDSLSQTVYVELIDRKLKSIVMSKTLRITNGFFNNDFRLPDTLAAKVYYLRAYTNFNRNFGADNLYLKPIPIYDITDKISSNQNDEFNSEDNILTITSDKQIYKIREKILLRVSLKDDEDKPIEGKLSIAVIDLNQVAQVQISGDILEEYAIHEIKEDSVSKNLPFQVEYGISFSGRFLNQDKRPEKATLNVLQINPNNFTLAQSDDKGIFFVSGFYFYDTAFFSVHSTRVKGEPYGHGEFVPRTPANIDFKESEYTIEIRKTEWPQRIIPNYLVGRDTRILEEVEIKATRIEEQYQAGYRVKRPYGKPDYVLKAKDINTSYGNLLQTLPGKVPGLIVREVTNNGEGTKWVVYVQRQTSIAFPAEVLVTVNDAIVTGEPASILSSINPNTVESIEVKLGINVLYGSVGGNGIVSIYTKKDFEQPKDTKAIEVMKVPGYSPAGKFSAPDYNDPKTETSQPDYRSTIYWNPDLTTDAKTGLATISFFAADLPGKYKVVAEGVTGKGEPVRCVYFVEINNN